jgi:hypothetical protein
MPVHVLYEVPMATWPVRLLMIAVCGVFVLAIYGWWLPRVLRVLRNLPAMGGGQAVTTVIVAVLPVVIGVGPLLVLIALLRNPIAYVTDTGVMQESVFSNSPVVFSWSQIEHVYCRMGSNGVVTSINVVAHDGRKIGFGNTGDVDFASMHELFQNQLGPVVAHRCERGLSR